MTDTGNTGNIIDPPDKNAQQGIPAKRKKKAQPVKKAAPKKKGK